MTFLELLRVSGLRPKFITWNLRRSIREIQTGSSIFFNLPRLSLDLCTAPTKKNSLVRYYNITECLINRVSQTERNSVAEIEHERKRQLQDGEEEER